MLNTLNRVRGTSSTNGGKEGGFLKFTYHVGRHAAPSPVGAVLIDDIPVDGMGCPEIVLDFREGIAH